MSEVRNRYKQDVEIPHKIQYLYAFTQKLIFQWNRHQKFYFKQAMQTSVGTHTSITTLLHH